MAIKSVSIRIEEEMLNKLHVVADYEGRSANSQILVLIRDCIKEYESKIECKRKRQSVLFRRCYDISSGKRTENDRFF